MNETLFALTSKVHYQSGEDIVVILCHHPHSLCLEGCGDEGWERKVGMDRDRVEKKWSFCHLRTFYHHLQSQNKKRFTKNVYS